MRNGTPTFVVVRDSFFALLVALSVAAPAVAQAVATDPSPGCLSETAADTRGRSESSHTRFLVLDLSQPEGTSGIANRIFSFARDDADPVVHPDLVTLVQLAQQMVFGIMEAGPKYSFTFSEYYLTKIRATLKVAGTLLPDAKNADASGPLNTSLITGPREHFFLSANAAFTKIKQIKYDDKAKTLEPAATPNQFMVGLDYTYGDLFDDAKQSGLRSFLEGFYLGLAVEGSTSPFNQIALTLGFRHVPGLEKYVSFEAVSPYVGYLLVRNDRIVESSGSTAIESKYAKKEFVYGLSLNLSKALGWAGK